MNSLSSSISNTGRPEAQITLQDAAAYPLPGAAVPHNIAFSSDNRLISYLFSADGSLTHQLYSFDPQTGVQMLLADAQQAGNTEENLSLEEKLLRERQRQRTLGITQYSWSKKGNRILVPLKGSLYIKDDLSGDLRLLVESIGKPLLDAQFSPDGDWVSFVKDAEVYVIAVEGGEARQLTHGARGTGKTHGLAEYIAQEEMGRSRGYWWSPDSQWIAFAEVDETHIPLYRIQHQGMDEVGENAQEEHRYPFAGQANALVDLGVIPVGGGDVTWMDLGVEEDVYLARVAWLPDGSLTAQVENREQSSLKLLILDPQTGRRQTLLTESSSIWINLHDMFYPLRRSGWERAGGFIWASERSGFCHLYLYDNQGSLVRTLTHGEWMVESIVGVDEQRQQVYFMATEKSPLESHLYGVSLEGGEPRRLTAEPGMHSVVIDRGFERFVDSWSTLDTPPQLVLRSLQDGSLICEIYQKLDPRIAQLNLQTPEIVELESRDGVPLFGVLYRPPTEFGAGPYPTVVSVYGGPHKQMVQNSWQTTVAMRAQYLAKQGFLVFSLDNRGSSRRGLNFEGAIKQDMGHIEVDDQVDGVRWLASLGLADPERVGIYGWSYGGYLSAMCLMRAPETFKAAVAGAPVSCWDGYDTHYTERYMGTPQSNPQGYQGSSLLPHAAGLQGRLLLIHGLIDENVHFRHTARLINALIRAGKAYDLLLFPDERHMPRKLEDRVFMEERIRDFFLANL